MKVVFWNTARGKSKRVTSEAVEKIIENCVGLAYSRPEVIILCEGLKGTRKVIRNKGGLEGYSIVKPSELLGGYTDKNTLRYIIFARNDVNCIARYCDTGTDRPAVHITACGIAFLAVHAPSVPNSTLPQSRALNRAFLLTPLLLAEPAFIVGDLNVDAFNRRMRGQLEARLDHDFFPVWDRRRSTRPKSGKSLDWALVSAAFTRAVTVRVLDDVDDEGSDDDEWRPPILSTGKSDHEAIVVEVT